MSNLNEKDHLAIEGKELAMLVAETPKGDKSIIWHGPNTIYSDHQVNGKNSSINAEYKTDSINYVASLTLDNSVVTKKINRSDMFNAYRSISYNKYITEDNSKVEDSDCLYKITDGKKYSIEGWKQSPIFEDGIDFLYYSGNKFNKGIEYSTDNTLPSYKKPNAEINWDGPDYPPSSVGGRYKEEMSTSKKWPLIVKYEPSDIIVRSNQTFSCWDVVWGDVPTTEQNPLFFEESTDEYGATCWGNQVAQLQFGTEYPKLVESKVPELTEGQIITHPWHFHFGENNLFRKRTQLDGINIITNVGSRTSYQENFLRCHPYCMYSLASVNRSWNSEVLLKIKDKDGNTQYTPIWSAIPGKTYNMFVRDYGNSDNISKQVSPDFKIRYVTLRLKDPSVMNKNKWYKLAKDLAPYCRMRSFDNTYSSEIYVISYEVANDIWDLDSNSSNYKKALENTTNKFNKTMVPSWYDPDSNTNIMDNSSWFSLDDTIYDSYYDMLKGIFTVSTILEKTIESNYDSYDGIYNYGILYCEEADKNIAEGSSTTDFNDLIVSNIIVDDTNTEIRIAKNELSNYKCKINGNKYVFDFNSISDGDSIGDEVITYTKSLYIYSEIEDADKIIPGCIHKLLDSNVPYKNTDNAVVFTSRNSGNPAYCGLVNKSTNKLEFQQVSFNDPYAWKYKVTL